MEKLSYHLDVFNGPLDLLLALISKNKVEICEISISELLDQYLEQIGRMQEQQMEVSSEFLEMAARLVYLKTVSLLPKNEEAEELRRELTGQLMEYQEWKRTAQALAGFFSWDSFIRPPAPLPPERAYSRSHSPDELLAAYLSAAGRGKRFLPPPAESFDGIVTRKPVSVASRIIFVLRRLWKQTRMPFHDLLWESRQKSDLVATFLAVLELVKNHRVRVDGEDGGTTITLLTGGADRWK
ncbi:segregation and condensation protein A [Faecalispora anaeroviscerum]|uniref:segregation and condensation protein A n=1 Tax=Faecalispora anaeroviscerum TaxID=2991836 RepID=UPI0024B8C279|nr:segregation/condensation protein A [Faecalispora anaeroviscerum]